MVNISNQHWLSVQEVAALAGCTDSYVRFLIRQGKLPAQQVGRRSYIIEAGEARAFARTPAKTGRPRKFDKK